MEAYKYVDMVMLHLSLIHIFFGYKKSSVYEYISSMEEEFSERLLEKDEDLSLIHIFLVLNGRM